MLLYILKRLVYVTPVAIGVSIVCFLLVHLAPGDPLTAVLPVDATAEQQAEMRAAYGFDKPLPVQYGIWLWQVLHGDLGNSIATGRPVLSEVSRAVGNTLILASVATADRLHLRHASSASSPAISATRSLDKVASALSVLGVSVPHYWLGMVLVIIFSAQLGWLPPTGAGPDGSGNWRPDFEHLRYIILPAITMSVIPMGIIARTVRALVADILSQEFVQALRAKGLSECGVFKHVVTQRRADRARRHGPAARLPARRLDPDRDRVRLAGHRLPAQRRDLPARPAAAAGHDPRAGDVLRRASTCSSTCCRPRSIRASSGALTR